MSIFQTGDKVKFLNDVGGGKVTRIENNMVFVQNDDGFEIPVNASQLLKTEATQAEATPFQKVKPAEISKTQNNEPEIQPQPVVETDYIDLSADEQGDNSGVTVNVWMAWTANRNKTGDTDYRLYLINDCSYQLMYVAAMLREGSYRGIQAGRLENENIIHLITVSGNDLKLITLFDLQILFFKTGNFLPQDTVQYRLKVDEFYLTDPINYQPNEFLDEKALLINVTQEALVAEMERNTGKISAKMERQKRQIDQPAPPRIPTSKEPDNTNEIDLHIEQLTDDYKHLTPVEILDMQMSRFRIALQGAINSKQKTIIFIHGVGNGRLRLEIQRILKKEYPNLRYQDASFKEYGYGATLVFCK
ncbi:MAG: DUF2027 domain-containing protein [Bacteroidales bacterium]|jgi:hypothetical protein|nr:DUF2027 domain-containing protein [Bacteroidales bacterium]